MGLQTANVEFKQLPAGASSFMINAQCEKVPTAWCASNFNGMSPKVACNMNFAKGEGCP